MRRLILSATILAGLLFGMQLARADDSKDSESLPSPRSIPQPPPTVLPPIPPPSPPFMRPNPYDRWQAYGIDHSYGHFRLRVIDAPYGPYYYYNGAPYPWPLTHQQWNRLYTSQPANFQGAVETPPPMPPAKFLRPISTSRSSSPDFMPYAED